MIELSPYKIISQKDYYYNSDPGLTSDDIENIISHIKSKSEPYSNNGYEEEDENTPNLNRKSWVIYPDNSQEMYKLFSFINENAREANKKFNFDLHDIVHFVYMEYKDNSDISLDWHIDIAGGESSIRKLSFSFIVSDENEYDGGDLEIWLDRGEPKKIPKTRGGIAFFPSFLLHRVTKVTKGTRRVIVGMYGGTPYR